MNVRTTLLAIFIAFAATGWCVAGTTGVLHGYVRNYDGAPAADAVVTASSPIGTFQRHTDRAGFFVFLALPPSVYSLRVEMPGTVGTSVAGVRINSDQLTVLGFVASRLHHCPFVTHVTVASDQRTEDFSSFDVARMAVSPPGSFLVPLVPAAPAPTNYWCL